jgi:hypothetical protein
MDVALLDYHWFRNRRGLDVVMRAAGVETRGYEAGDEEAAQAAAAGELKAAMGADTNAAMLVGRLGPELEEAYALLDWAKESMQTFGQLPAASKKEAYADPDWAKLNGRLHQVLELSERVQDVPALAALFPYKGKAEPLFQHQPRAAGGLKL